MNIVITAMFEIEKKFKLSEGFEERLREHGGKYLKKVCFTDTYFDNSKHLLTLNDYWLRCRERGGDKQWELKVPFCGKREKDVVRIDKFKEIANEQEIVDHLSLHPDIEKNKLKGLKGVVEAIHVM